MSFFGEPKFETGQVSITTDAILIVPARSNRRSLMIIQHGTNAVYLGNDREVTTTTGVLLTGTAGAGLSLPVTGEVWGIAGATQTISYIEVYLK